MPQIAFVLPNPSLSNKPHVQQILLGKPRPLHCAHFAVAEWHAERAACTNFAVVLMQLQRPPAPTKNKLLCHEHSATPMRLSRASECLCACVQVMATG